MLDPLIQQILTACLVILMVVALYKDWLKPVVTFASGIAILLALNILTVEQALAGFSNENVAVIILLLVVSSIIQKGGLIEHALNLFFKGANSYKSFSFRMVAFVSVVSGFLNNTPVVATFLPYVFTWGRRNQISPSKLLIPLSYAAIMGGMLTLIGTSTNLIVNGLAKEQGFSGFNIFDFAFVGIPVVFVGACYILIFGNKLLPNRIDALKNFEEHTREYLVETKVLPLSPLIDKTVSDAELRSLKGLFLVEIIRGNRQIGPVKPSQNIREGDHLIFAGDTATIPDLLNTKLGLELPKLRDIPEQEHIKILEAVIARNSLLVGKKVRETDFRGVFDAAIVGVHRNGERLIGKIGDVELQVGDILVLMAGRDFSKRIDNRSFYLLSEVKEIEKLDKKRAWGLTVGALAAIILSAIGLISLFKALLIFIVLSLLLKLVRPSEVQRGIDFNLAFIAALSIGIGHAMIASGLANELAQKIVFLSGSIGAFGLLVVIYIFTNVLTEFITNVAAASIALPIALTLANHLALPQEPFIFAVAFAASASFLTPIGYQTNLMVLGPGGYRFKDYFKFGFPLSILCMITTIAILSLKYGLL